MQIIPLKQGNDTYVSIDQSFFISMFREEFQLKHFRLWHLVLRDFSDSKVCVSGIEIGNLTHF